MYREPSRIFFVCHGDHNFDVVKCTLDGSTWTAHMDNLLGVYTCLQAYFSGKLPTDCCNIQITYGEEKSTVDKHGNMVGFAGAREVMETITEDDLIVVVDVTSLPEKYKGFDFSIEKCQNPVLGEFLRETFKEDFKYDIFEYTPDTEAFEDETDAFIEVTKNVFFFGVVVWGGDYNAGPVKSSVETNKKAVEALILLANSFKKNWNTVLEKMPKSVKGEGRAEFDKLIHEIKELNIECESEDLDDEQSDLTEIIRKLRFTKTPIMVELSAPEYEGVLNIEAFLEKLRHDKLMQQQLAKIPEESKGTSLVAAMTSAKLTDFFWKQVQNEELFDNKFVLEAFTLKKQGRRSIVMKFKQKKVDFMMLYLRS